MYSLSVVHLRQFYATELGTLAAAALSRACGAFVTGARGEALLALGYPLPLLGAQCRQHNEVVVAMPATLGALYWPPEGANLVCLVHEGDLPLREHSINRAVLLHALEHSEELPHLMRELSRVLTPSGRVLVLVPNRLSLWARSSATPFGYGRPFSLQQMKDLLNAHDLTFMGARSCLFLPPTHARFFLKGFKVVEWLGRFFLPGFGGVLVIEAGKQVYAGIAQPVRVAPRLRARAAPASARILSTIALAIGLLPFAAQAQALNPFSGATPAPTTLFSKGVDVPPAVPTPLATFTTPEAPEEALPVMEKVDGQTPVLLSATQMDYDSEGKIAVASGQVEIVQGPRVLLADKVSYYELSDVVIAEGNVSLLDPDGRVMFADKVQLNQEMKTGVVEQFAVRMEDQSLFAARHAERKSDDVTDLFAAVYTPCYVTCSDGSPTTPTWQLRAKDVHIDQAAQTVTYQNAWMEFLDVPVLYTPYFSHPTPGADNKSGFLTPTYRYSNNLGWVFDLPYYYAIAPDQDVTITPIITTLEGPVLKGEYRAKYDRGVLFGIGSITVPQTRDASRTPGGDQAYRGHIDAKGFYNLSDTWNVGGQLQRTSDDTYLARYRFSAAPLLTSRAYVQGVNFIDGNTRNNATIQGLAFQGLKAEDDSRREPLVLPLAELNYQTNPLAYNSRVAFNTSLLSLTRTEGTDTRRLSVGTAWTVPYATPTGHLFEAKTSLRVDVYYVANNLLSNGKVRDGVEHRVTPEASLLWRYPLIRRGYRSNVTIEPLAGMVVSPNTGNPEAIPNEDSSTPEFTDLNMFSDNRYPGLDRVEGGPRAFYGGRGLWDSFDRGNVIFAVGQTVRLSNAQQFPLSNDLTSRVSDYVGRVAYNIRPFTVGYRFRLDKQTFQTRRDELDATYSGSYFALSANYLRFDEDPIAGSSEEINGGVSVMLTPQWTTSFATRRDLKLDQLTSASSGLTYQDECFTFLLQASRDLATDRDLRDTTSFVAQVVFKNLE